MPETNRTDNDISRDNFDSHWLLPLASAHSYQKLEHLPVQEIDGSRQRVERALRQAITDHHIHRQRIAERLRSLGHEAAAAFFSDELPKNQQTRKGNFGEVVASEHMMQRFGCAMPVLKLRYRDSAKLPMRGEDIVAFRIEEGRITCVYVGEAKTGVTYRRQTVLEAHHRLDQAYHPRPLTLAMIAQILYDRGDNDLAAEIDRVADELTRRDFPRENWIFLINESEPTDPFGCLDTRNDIVPNLRCVNLALPKLTNFVDDLFERAMD